MSVLDQQLSRKYKLNFPRLLRSEWIKFFSLRSTWWLSIVAVVCNIGIVAGLAALVRYIEGQANLPAGADVETAVGFSSLSALVVQGCGLVGQLVFVILAILAITNEDSSGMIRSTVTAAPRRVRVLLAKMVVILVTGVLIFGLSLAGGWGVGYLLLQDSRLIDLTLLTAASLRILLGFVAKMVLLALLSFGIGAWIRSTAGSIGAALGLFILLPFIGNLVVTLSSGGGELTGWRLWLSDAVAFLPTNASDLVLMDTVPTSSILTAWEGLGVLGAWTLLFLVISIIATVRRDL